MKEPPNLPDEFERELASFAPRPASQRLKNQIAARLAPRASLRRWFPPVAAAACFAIVLLLLVFIPRAKPVVPPPPIVQDGPSRATPDIPAIDLTMPSVVAYNRAYAQSELLFDFLLEAHAAAAHLGRPASVAPSATPQRLLDLSSYTKTLTEEPL